QGFEMPQHAVGAPIFRKLHHAARQVSGKLLQLGFKAREEREGVGGGARKPGQDLAVIEAAQFFGASFQDLVSHGDLSVTGQYYFAVAPNTQDCRRTDFSFHLNLFTVNLHFITGRRLPGSKGPGLAAKPQQLSGPAGALLQKSHTNNGPSSLESND